MAARCLTAWCVKKWFPKWFRCISINKSLLLDVDFLTAGRTPKVFWTNVFLRQVGWPQRKSRKRNWINQKSFNVGEWAIFRFFIVADDGGLGLLRLKFKGLLFFDWRVARVLGLDTFFRISPLGSWRSRDIQSDSLSCFPPCHQVETMTLEHWRLRSRRPFQRKSSSFPTPPTATQKPLQLEDNSSDCQNLPFSFGTFQYYGIHKFMVVARHCFNGFSRALTLRPDDPLSCGQSHLRVCGTRCWQKTRWDNWQRFKRFTKIVHHFVH